MTTKIYDNKNKENKPSETPPTTQQRIDSGQMPQYAENGLFHSPLTVQNIHYKVAPNEEVLKNEGSYIVLGTDRPDTAASGYGVMGSDRANSIDLVVGRMSNARKGEGPPGQEGGTAYVDNSMFADAARVLISQLTDVDKNFGLAAGNTGPSKARASIAAKADTIRLIGREGVNIVTGEALDPDGYGLTGETNSLGGRISVRAPEINLIAGNHTGTYITYGGIYHPLEKIRNLQPAVRGDLLRDALLEITDCIEDIFASLFVMGATSMMHNVLNAFFFPFYNWPASMGNATYYLTQNLNWVINANYQARINMNFIQFNYMNVAGYKYICSRNVNIT
jgi:hypothetical protein|tara:strand:- start:3299 stop:4306 length:1008 start_codon:yes stop_codon:yes gene_type:complete